MNIKKIFVTLQVIALFFVGGLQGEPSLPVQKVSEKKGFFDNATTKDHVLIENSGSVHRISKERIMKHKRWCACVAYREKIATICLMTGCVACLGVWGYNKFFAASERHVTVSKAEIIKLLDAVDIVKINSLILQMNKEVGEPQDEAVRQSIQNIKSSLQDKESTGWWYNLPMRVSGWTGAVVGQFVVSGIVQTSLQSLTRLIACRLGSLEDFIASKTKYYHLSKEIRGYTQSYITVNNETGKGLAETLLYEIEKILGYVAYCKEAKQILEGYSSCMPILEQAEKELVDFTHALIQGVNDNDRELVLRDLTNVDTIVKRVVTNVNLLYG